jgi:D-amino-acid dehydrogenase
MSEQHSIAVIGAGVIGSAVAYALAREGRSVVLLDRADPGVGGASFGNAGHIATELVQPLASPALLFGFWRELFALNGPLDVPARRLGAFLPWATRFGFAAFRRAANTKHLAPLVRPALDALAAQLSDMGRLDLLHRNGHYEMWLNDGASARALAQARAMEQLGVPTAAPPAELLGAVRDTTRATTVAGVWFPKTAHVTDPLEVVRAFTTAATARGAKIVREHVHALRPRGERIEVVSDSGSATYSMAIVCAGAWSPSLVAPFALKAPLESARGYHVELPGGRALIDAPILYVNDSVVVTPMASRLRASSFMEFAEPDAPADARKPDRLKAALRKLGYSSDPAESTWVGPRPVLPDYLPAIGRATAFPNLLYAFGHQHIGLTLAAVTADLISDVVAARTPRYDISAFDLRRFG